MGTDDTSGAASAAPLSPFERIGPAVSTLGEVRAVLFAETPRELYERAEQVVPTVAIAYAFSFGVLSAKLEAVRPLLASLWRELVAIEAALMPPTEPEEGEDP